MIAGRRVPIPLLALALALAPACSSDEERAHEHLERAAAWRAEGKLDEALLELQRALQRTPRNAEVCQRMGALLAARGRLADAAFYYHEAWRLDPARSDAALQVVDLVRFGDPEGAAEIVDAVLAREPDNPLAWIRRSQVHLVRNDAGAALEAARAAVEHAPGLGATHLQLGIAQQARIRAARLAETEPGDDVFAAALAAFDEALERAQTPAVRQRAALERARTLAWWPARRHEAPGAFRAAVTRAEADGRPGLLARAARATADYARAEKDAALERWALERLVEAGADLSTWLELAHLDDALGGSGAERLRARLEAQPRDALSHIAYARYLSNRRGFDAAAAHLRATADAGVAPAVMLAALAQLEYDRGDVEAGARAAGELAARFPDTRLTALALARRDIQRGRPQEALERLTRLAERTETYQERYLIALAQLALHDVPAATDAIDRARRQAPGWLLPLEQVAARTHYRAHRWTELVLALHDIQLHAGRLLPEQQVMLAHALYERGQPQAARGVLEPLLEGDAPHPGAVLEYAVRERTRRPARARELLAAAHTRAPDDLALLRLLVDMDVRAGHLDEARRRVEEARARRDPPPPPLSLLRAHLLSAGGDDDAAEAVLLRVLDREPGYGPAVADLVRLYAAQGRLDDAVARLEALASAGQLATGSRVLLARMHLERGERERGRELLETALAERADLPGAKNDLAWLLASEGRDLDRALRLAREACQALGDEPNAVDTLGFVFLKKGLHEAALAQFELALELAEARGRPDPALHYHHGLALAALARPEGAARAFETALLAGDTPPDGDFPEAPAVRQALEAARAAAADRRRPAADEPGAGPP